MTLTEFLAANLAVMLGSMVQAASGVGAGFIMAPLLALIDFSLVPGPLIFGSLSLSCIMAYRERGAIDARHFPSIIVGLLPGCLIGGALLSTVPVDRLGFVFGGVILLAIVITTSGFELALSRATAAGAALLAGIMGTSSGIGAPALALLYQHERGARIRSTLALLYTVASLLIIATLLAFGEFSGQSAVSGALLVPGFLAGYLAANKLVTRVDGRWTRIAVLGTSGTAALALILRSLL